VLVLLYTILFFILAAIVGALLTVVRDGCVNVEELIIDQAEGGQFEDVIK